MMGFQPTTKRLKRRTSLGYGARLRSNGNSRALHLAACVRRDIDASHVVVMFDPDRRAIALKPSGGSDQDAYKISANCEVAMWATSRHFGFEPDCDGRVLPCKREGDLFVFELDTALAMEAPGAA